jgi:ribulose kinase
LDERGRIPIRGGHAGDGTRRALEEGGVSPRGILGIGVDATASTLLAVDEQGGPLLPAIM